MKIDANQTPSVVSSRVTIKAPQTSVWKIISSPGHLSYCHPFCKENPVQQWNGIGSEDTIVYYNGLKLNRVFTAWHYNAGYELLIGKGEIALAHVEWNVLALKDGYSTLEITIHSYPDVALQKYPSTLRKPIRIFYFIPHMKRYVKSVVRGIKFYAENSQPVRLNQFGYNRMFSIKSID